MNNPPSFLRILLIGAVALGLAPGTFLRSQIDPDPADPGIAITALSDHNGITGTLEVTGLWQLRAKHPFFGGFSALVADDNGGLLAGSDRGWTLRIPVEGGEPSASAAEFSYFAQKRDSFEEMVDLEAMSRDPATGILWSAYENFNALQRDTPDGATARRAPPEMQGWSANSGPETMVRLAGGAFILLGEAPEQSGLSTRPGLLFASDPIDVLTPIQFRFRSPPGYSPVDATALPDGSVLILLRRVQISIPAVFDTAIMRADPAAITPGGEWSGEIIAQLSGPVLGENFEGIAYVAGESAIYLIADDNLSMFQRSLLLRLGWRAANSPL
ncbi:esterase-like activity of phytase family protein [Qipengyuania sp. ASV99]|uniref:esterase-like activity of phytase family protein n=1 Tax=Qipengyuania sp. ASV99 TaxID=3399681 RepID=UPI003A4C57DE